MTPDDMFGYFIVMPVCGILALSLYFLPSIVARLRHHQSIAAIFVTNLLLGWTVIGWLILLFYSFSTPGSKGNNMTTNVNVNQNVAPWERRDS